MLQLLPPDDCQRLLDFFSEAGYTFEAMSGHGYLQERASHRFGAGAVKYLLEKTAEPTASHTLARWFAVGVPVPAAVAHERLPAWVTELLLKSGMIRRNADQLAPSVMLSPLGTMLVASDPVFKWENDPSDFVVWPHSSAWQLLNFTIRKPFSSALDLGCGCGIQALGAASHCEIVVATDLNPRAALFTAFNARLNGIANVECVSGDLYAPVAGRRFDLIVMNPPFFISPESGLLYCENPLELDLFCRRVAREAPQYLNESGFLQMVCEWVEIKDQPWRERVAEWLDSSGCDAWIIRQYTSTPLQYGADRTQQRPPGTHPEGGEFFANWVDYVQEKKITAVHGGLITMRKRSGANWLRIEDEPVSIDSVKGDLILKGFEVRDALDSASDAALMEIRPRLAQDARLVQQLGQSDQGWSAQSLRLHLASLRPRQIDIDPNVAQFVVRFNGSASLGDLIRELAGRANAPMEQVARESVALTRKLLDEGYLVI